MRRRRIGPKSLRRQRLFESLQPRIVLNADVPGTDVPGDVAEPPGESAPAIVSFETADDLTEKLLDKATDRWAHLFGEPLDWPIIRPAGDIWSGDDRPESESHPENDPVYASLGIPFPFPDGRLRDGFNQPVIQGNHLYSLVGGQLSIYDIEDPATIRLASRIDVGAGGELHLAGDRLAIVGHSRHVPFREPPRLTDVHHLIGEAADRWAEFEDLASHRRPEIYPPPDVFFGTAKLTVFDVADPAQPEQIHTSIVSGSILDATVMDGSLQAVHQQAIHLPRPQPDCDHVIEFPRRIVGGIHEIIDVNPLEFTENLTVAPDWDGPFPEPWPIPACQYESEDAYVTRLKDVIQERALASVFSPESGESTALSDFSNTFAIADDSLDVQVSVLTIDLQAEEIQLDAVSVLGERVQSVEFDSSGVVLAGVRHHEGVGASTGLTLFEFAENGVELSAVGEVKGRPALGESLDLHDGSVRVVTTHRTAEEATQRLSILSPESDELIVVREATIGEHRPVAFASLFGDTGVIGPLLSSTPLQAIDLSGLAAPGSLQLSGFAGFLEVIGDSHVLALGNSSPDATALPIALDLSLHDLSNVEDPLRLDHIPLIACHEETLVIPAGLPELDAENGVLVMPVIELSTAEAVELAKGHLPRLLEFPIAQELMERVRRLLSDHTDPFTLLRRLTECFAGGETDPIDSTAAESNTEAEFGRRPWFETQLRVWSVDASAEDALQLLGNVEHDLHRARTVVGGDHLFVVTGHDVVAYALSDLSTPVGSISTGPFAVKDHFEVDADAQHVSLDVLANDRIEPGTATIIHVGEARGDVQISDDGQAVLYSPPHESGFAALDGFVYRAQSENGITSEAFVSIELTHKSALDRMIRLVIHDLAERLDVETEEIEVVATEDKIWPDGCLGVDGVCTLAIVPGFIIQLEHADQIYVYHTDRRGIFKLVEREAEVRVVPDAYTVLADSGPTRLNVLANDFPGIAFIRQPLIEEVTQPDSGSRVEIGPHGGTLLYSPAENFVGVDEFTYTVDLGLTATVTVTVEEVVALVQYSIEITNSDGEVVSHAMVGDTLLVNVFVEDLRGEPSGVFAGYLDLEFSDHADPVGSITYGSAYPNGQEGVIEPGVVDEAGAFASFDPIGSGQFLLMQIPFIARDQGLFVVEADAADAFVVSETLVFGLDRAVLQQEIRYDRAAVEIANPLHNENQPTDVNGDGETTSMDALAAINKLNEDGSGPVTAADFATAGEGEVPLHYYYDVSNDGQLSPMDPLVIINLLNGRMVTAIDAEGEADSAEAKTAETDVGISFGSTEELPAMEPSRATIADVEIVSENDAWWFEPTSYESADTELDDADPDSELEPLLDLLAWDCC